MKYERTTLNLAVTGEKKIIARAVRVGDWYAHIPIDGCVGDGVNIAHKSGIGLLSVNPIRAVRLLKTLQDFPPCPVSDDIARFVVSGKIPASPKFREWSKKLKDTIKDLVQD